MEKPRPHCLKEGTCLDQNSNQMTTCPSDRESLRYIETTPLVPAEQLCLAGLRAVKESRPKSELVDRLASASYDLDRAIAIPRFIFSDDSFASNYIERDNREVKRQIFGQVVISLHGVPKVENIDNPGHLPIALQLRRLSIFMPAFRTRVEETTINHGLITQTHVGLSGYIADLERQMHVGSDHRRKKQIAAHKAECEVMALLTRLGDVDHFPYPALPREEVSHARKQYNHDFYTLPKSEKKPAQVKTSSQGNGYDGVAIIKHYDILRSLKRDPVTHQVQWDPSPSHEDFEWPNPYRYEQLLTGDAPDPLAALLIEEVQLGKKLSADKKNVLNLASHYVLSRMG